MKRKIGTIECGSGSGTDPPIHRLLSDYSTRCIMYRISHFDTIYQNKISRELHQKRVSVIILYTHFVLSHFILRGEFAFQKVVREICRYIIKIIMAISLNRGCVSIRPNHI